MLHCQQRFTKKMPSKMDVERVQVIAEMSKSTDSIPNEYIRSEDEQPGMTMPYPGPVPEVPVIDFSENDEQKLVEKMVEASAGWGMFQVVNHEIPNEVIEKLQQVGEEFFELPQEEKEKIAKVEGSKNVEGYGTKLQKEVAGKKGWVDHLFHRVWPPASVDLEFWPQNPSAYREANEEYTKNLHCVANKLLKTLSLGAGLEGHVLKEAIGGEDLIYMMKINYYPPCPRPDLALGVVAHTDMSALTILLPNDVQGLQIYKDCHWLDVAYIPNALIVHIGDQLEIMSNGKYKAVLHRSIVNKDKTRISWPVFLEPPSECMVGPHPKLVNESNPAKFKTKTYSDYTYCKLNKIPQ